MFLIYVNDIVDVVDCDLKLFADDTILYVTVDNDLRISTNELNRNLQNFKGWSNEWFIKFNPSKTKLLNVSSKRSKNFENHPVIFDQTQLTEVKTQKHLGILLNNELKWSDHILMQL